jgi:hypothetical protein
MTLGSILFAGTGGLLTQNNSNLFWDNTNSILGIGTSSPKTYSKLTVNGALITLNNLSLSGTSAFKLNSYYNSATITDKAVVTGYAGQIGINASGIFSIYSTAASVTADSDVSYTERIRITSDNVTSIIGSAGISTTSPRSYTALTVNGQTLVLSNFIIDKGQSYRFNTYYNSGTTTDRAVSTGYTGDFYLDNSSGFIYFRSSNSSVTADTNTSQVARIAFTSSGNTIIQNGGSFSDAGYRLDVNGTLRSQGDVTISDTKNIIFGTTTGNKIGTATSQKMGFWNATPIVQPTTAVAAATLVGGGGTALTDTDTFDGYTIKQIVKALRNTGLLA